MQIALNRLLINAFSLSAIAGAALCSRGVAQDGSQFGFLSGGGGADFAPSDEDDTASGTEPATGEGEDPAPEEGEISKPEAAEALSRSDGHWLPSWLSFDLTLQSIYDDNIFLTDARREGDWINRFTPAFRGNSAISGDQSLWTVEGAYYPTGTIYTSDSDLNSFDQAGNVILRYSGEPLSGLFMLSYVETTGNDRFAQGLFTTNASRADLRVDYELSPLTTLETRLLFENLDREDTALLEYNDDQTLSLQVSALWGATPITKIGPSLRFGKTDSTLSPDRQFVDGLVRIEYDSQALLRFSLEAGAQWISFDGDRDSLVKPSVSLVGKYDINALWQLTVTGYSRSAAATSVTNSDLQASGVNGTVRWIPSEYIQVSAGGGFEKARYEFFDDSPERVDDYAYGELRMRAGNETSRYNFEFFYRHRFADSTAANADFENNQAGIQISRRF